MNINLENLTNNIISITPINISENNQQSNNDINCESDSQSWINNKIEIANKIFQSPSAATTTTTIVVTKWPLDDILTVASGEFFNQLFQNMDYLIETYNLITKKFTFESNDYIITCLCNTPPPVIGDLVDSYQFTMGNLFLICHQNKLANNSIGDDIMCDIIEVLKNSTFMSMPNIKCEMLASSSDGCQLLWFNPTDTWLL